MAELNIGGVSVEHGLTKLAASQPLLVEQDDEDSEPQAEDDEARDEG